MMKNLDLEPHDREVKISISSRKLKKVSRRSLVPTRAGEHFGDYQAAMRKPAPVRRGGDDEEEGSSSWMADHTRSHHGGVISDNPLDDYDFLLIDQNRKPLLRQLEEAVRIKMAKTSGIVMLGRGPKAKRLLVNRVLLNRKMENYSPWLLTLDGG